jgi:hypothetical protein
MALSALALAGVLGVAARLTPDPRGYGTHTQLGLAPCAFQAVTGTRCPTCGMTTSFAWFVRGRFGRSWRASPVGSLLAPVCVVMVPWLLVGAAWGRPVACRSVEGPVLAVVSAAVAISLLFWMIRLFLGRALR